MTHAAGPGEPAGSGGACLNCGADTSGNFCAECGQSTSTGRLATRDTLRDIVGNLFQLDSKILRTVVGLTRNPGLVCADYVAGKRVRYVAPFKYFLVSVTLMILVNLATGFDPVQVAGEGGSERAREMQRAVASFALQHLDLAILIALPFYVAAVRWVFRGAGYTYAEVSVFVLFVIGHVSLLGLVFGPLRAVSPMLGVAPKLVLQVVFFSWASIRFFRVSAVSSVLRNLFLLGVYFVLMVFSILFLSLPDLLAVIETSP